jgi:predicted component of type VI protein secretion system
MALRLRIVGNRAGRLGANSTHVFSVHGGRIGRAGDNDWVLPDEQRYVSGHHAAVDYRAGRWILVDTSSNGTFLNGAHTPLRASGARMLNDGDRLKIGDYDIQVSISPDNDFPPDASELAAFDGGLSGDFAIATHGDIGAELDLQRLLSSAEPPASPPLEMSDAYGQAVSVPAHEEVRPSPPAPVPRPRPTAVPSGRRDPQALAALGPAVQILARGAGLDPGSIAVDRYPTVLAIAGQLLREMTMGLTAALKTRTATRPAKAPVSEANPLETAHGVEEAISRLLAGTGGRFPPSVDMVRQTFTDLRGHEVALASAVRYAIDEYVKRFAPNELQAQFDPTLRRQGFDAATAKSRYWDLYGDLYRALAQMDDAGIPHAFADTFARAYATVLADELAAQARKPGNS